MSDELTHSRTPEARTEPPADGLELPAVLAALADPGRLAIVRALSAHGEGCCTDLADLAGLTIGKSTLSHHMRVLRESGITHTRAQGTHRYVTLRRGDLDTAFPRLLDAVIGAAATGAPAAAETTLATAPPSAGGGAASPHPHPAA